MRFLFFSRLLAFFCLLMSCRTVRGGWGGGWGGAWGGCSHYDSLLCSLRVKRRETCLSFSGMPLGIISSQLPPHHSEERRCLNNAAVFRPRLSLPFKRGKMFSVEPSQQGRVLLSLSLFPPRLKWVHVLPLTAFHGKYALIVSHNMSLQ